MKQPALGLSAFSLPKLKRDVAAKLLPTARDAGQNSQQGLLAQPAAADTNSKEAAQQQLGRDTDPGPADENVDPSSPHVNKPAAKPASKQPATARKGSRRTKQMRVSEQHTVYFDALGSPEDASARTQQKTHILRGAAAAAASGPAPASVHSKPSRPPSAAADADADLGGISSAYEPEAECFDSQPEPMEEDEPYTACAGPAGKTPAAAGRKQAKVAPAQQQQQDREPPIPRPSSRQQRHAVDNNPHAATTGVSRKQAAAAAAADAQETEQDSRQQHQQQRRGAGGRAARSTAAQAVAEAAAMALDDSESEEGSDGPAAAASAGQTGSQEHLRDGQEIYK